MDKSNVTPVCDTCPSRFFSRGEFNISDSDKTSKNFNPTKRFRVDESGTPTCIHPERVGISADNSFELGGTDVLVSPVPRESGALSTWIFDALVDAPQSEFDTVLDKLHELSTAANISEELFVDACRRAFAQLSQQ